MRPVLPIAVAAAVLLAASACAHRRHMRAGEQRTNEGRYEEAVLEYAEACRADPESEDAQRKLAQASEQLAAQRSAEVERALAAEDYGSALRFASLAQKRLPHHRRIEALVREVSDKTRLKSRELATAGAFGRGLSMLEALAAALPSEEDALREERRQIRLAWTTSLEARAAAARSAHRPSEAHLLLSKAAQLSPSPERTERRLASRRELDPLLVYPVQLVGLPGDLGLRHALEAFRRHPPSNALRIFGPSDPPPPELAATVNLAFSAPAFETRRSARTATATYQSGMRQVENPFHRMRRDALEREERALIDREEDVHRREREVAHCQADRSANSSAEHRLASARRDLESAQAALIAQRREVQRAREAFRREPAWAEEPAYSQLGYPVTVHHLLGSVRLSGGIEHRDGRPAIELAFTGQVAARDETHAEQPLARLAEDPLELPSTRELTEELYDQGLDWLWERLLESVDGHRAALLAEARAAQADRVDRWARYVLSDLQRVDPEAVAQLEALTGIPDPIEALTAP